MNPEPEPEVKFIPPENKPSVAVGVFNGLALFFIVLPVGLLIGIPLLFVGMMAISTLGDWLANQIWFWLICFLVLGVWKWRIVFKLFQILLPYVPVVTAWPFRKLANGAGRFVNYLKTGYATLD